MKRKFKRVLALMLVVTLCMTNVSSVWASDTGTSIAENVQNDADDPAEVSVEAETNELEVSGTGSVGTMIASTISEELEENEETSESACAISDLLVEGSTATVEFQTDQDSLIVVAVYTEDGAQMLASGTADVDSEDSQVDVTIEGDMPEYFLVTAFLLTRDGYEPLADAFTSELYTEEIQNLIDRTTEDFDSELVLNLDENTDTNFGVYGSDVILVQETDGINTLTDNGDGTYTITNADETFTEMAVGDVFVYAFLDGTVLIVKVAAISVSGTTVTITADEDIDLDDVFDYLKIESTGDEEIVVDNSELDEEVTFLEEEEGIAATALEKEGSVSKTLPYKLLKETWTNSSGTVTGGYDLSASLGIQANMKLYISLTYAYVEASVTATAKVSGEIKAAISVEKKLGNVSVMIVEGVNIGFTPAVKFTAEGKVSLNIEFKTAVGFSWSSSNGFSNTSYAPKMTDCSLNVEATVYVALILSPKVSLGLEVDGISLSAASVVVTAEMGGKLNASMEWSATETSYKHACDICVAGELYIIGKVSVTLSLLWWDKTASLLDKEYKYKDFYYSFTYGDYGWTTCPHLSYKVTVTATDAYGNALADAVIGGTGLDADPITDDSGEATFYLGNGDYTLSVTSGDQYGEQEITVDGEAQTVTIHCLNANGKTIPDDAVEYNGHYYYVYTDQLTWINAENNCVELGGHLATITSSDEQAFIETLSGGLYWIGGYCDENFNWYWVTGEEWNYTNWAEDEPNNDSGEYPELDEQYVAVWPYEWNDLVNASTEQEGYICEWDEYTCDEFISANSNMSIPEDVVTFNGNSYRYYYNYGYTWEEAKKYCETLGGHLVTITSQEEQDAVFDYVQSVADDEDIWIGLTDADGEGNWNYWVTGEEVTYTNWGTGEPDNLGEQNYGVICNGYRNDSEYSISPGQWDDIDSYGSLGSFICEWEGTAELVISDFSTALSAVSEEEMPTEISDEALETLVIDLEEDTTNETEMTEDESDGTEETAAATAVEDAEETVEESEAEITAETEITSESETTAETETIEEALIDIETAEETLADSETGNIIYENEAIIVETAYAGTTSDNGGGIMSSFAELVSGEQYVLIVVKDADAEELLAAENLLFIAQGIAGSDGTLSFTYILRESAESFDAAVYGAAQTVVSLETCTITLSYTSITYSGSAKKPSVTVKNGDTKLTAGSDYSVTYANNTNAGTATVTVTGTGNYTGEVVLYFTINKASQTLTASVDTESIGIGETAAITAIGTGTITYSSSDSSIASVDESGVVTGLAEGTVIIIVSAEGNANYNSASKELTITVGNTDDSQDGSDSSGGTGSSTDTGTSSDSGSGTNTGSSADSSAGTGTATGAQGSTGTESGTTNTDSANAAGSQSSTDGDTSETDTFAISSLTNTSKGIKLSWTMADGADGYNIYRKTTKGKYTKIKTITSGAKLSYTDTKVKKKNGTTYIYKVVPYTGSVEGTASAPQTTVRLVAVKLSGVTSSAAKKATVKWKKTTKVSGYQIQYSTSKKFKSGSATKTVKVSGAKKVSKVLSKLKSGKTYYVRIRTYKKVNGTTYYSAWSSKKKVKVS
ncbi:MAG: hypothetical protein LUG99_21220 [Lachnospiraceae bacterium]|nr:hypothetical protein [Lachnospiraceae bacterium]